MRKATRKLITQGINVVLLLTTLFFGVWSTANVAFGFNVTVTYKHTVLGVMRNLNEDPLTSAWTKTDDNEDLIAGANQYASVSEFDTGGAVQDDYAISIYGGTLQFYKDIDIVNMRVSDGKIVARLSDSESGFVWTGTRSGEQVDVMTYYPGHYIKRWQADGYEYIQLSMWAFDDAVYIAPYYRGTFKSIIDTTTYGNAETTKILRSYASSIPTGSTTIDKFRDYAGNNPNEDNRMSLGDWRDFDFQCLYLIKYADYNSQTKVGLGITDLYSVQINGLGNAHTTLLGRDGYIGTNGSTSVWCLGLCDFWGNLFEFIDGITINSGVACIATNPVNYTNGATSGITGYTNMGYTNLNSNGYPKATGYAYNLDNSNSQLIAFAETSGGSDTTGLCDFHSQDNSLNARVVLRGGSFYDAYSPAVWSGAFCFYYLNDFTLYTELCGCRLLKTA
ncbi:MAG: hypothetical protein PHR96_00925 [Clostridia bacterium]|nr:hypothetical protein [Clostridia bacterium]